MKKIFIFLVLIGIILMTPWMIISFVTRDVIFSSIESVPNKKYGLLLGTSPGSKGGKLCFGLRHLLHQLLCIQGWEAGGIVGKWIQRGKH